MSTDLNQKLYGTGLVGAFVPPSRGVLNDKLLIPPFSTWNTREDFWQSRKRKWIRYCGIDSGDGRDEALTYAIPETLSDGRKGAKVEAQTSIFDPVVCELAYNWWCPRGGIVLDPFCGGSVRGIVASMLGLKYYGIDLRQEQIDANYAQLTDKNRGQYKPKWICGDSLKKVPDAPACDFVFSCPPYGNLEVYSDLEEDISNKSYTDFLDIYTKIIGLACEKLKEDSFAVWVVANYRNQKTGTMYDFVGDTVRAFAAGGLSYYNDIILVNCVGSGAMRSNNTFNRGHRKVVKLHQNVLTFVKGNPEKAASKLEPLK